MDKSIKGDHKHLTLSDRIYIEQALIRGDNFREIARHLSKAPVRFLWRLGDFWNGKMFMVTFNTIRDSLNGHSPYEVAQLLQNKEVLLKLGLKYVSPDNINLTSALLK